VTSLEGVNARHLRPGDLPRRDYDVVTLDLSFISLRSVLPAVWPFLRLGGALIALVKPQFEAGKEEVGRGRGVIRDDAVRHRVFAEVRAFALAELPGARVRGEMESPLAGADGNREFLLGLGKASSAEGVEEPS
jgi:23S rRNA (cytidine1920-2'-O)/16S rRNA (cytidine1409-2'-O)-methyltransferase